MEVVLKDQKCLALQQCTISQKKYRDGSVASAEELSTLHRMDNRSNQHNEGGNAPSELRGT